MEQVSITTEVVRLTIFFISAGALIAILLFIKNRQRRTADQQALLDATDPLPFNNNDKRPTTLPEE